MHYDGLIVVAVDNIDCSCNTESDFYILNKFQDQETYLCNFVDHGFNTCYNLSAFGLSNSYLLLMLLRYLSLNLIYLRAHLNKYF